MKVKVAFLSAGLGNVLRGFEISAVNWYKQVKDLDELQVQLYAGGCYEDAIEIWNFPRNGKMASFLRKLNLLHDGCRLEQISFGLSLVYHIIAFKPHIIWFQEGTLGNILLFFRRFFGFRFKLVFCDGAPVGYNFAKRFDYIIFLHRYALEDAVNDGVDVSRCAVIPYLSMVPDIYITKEAARTKLNIPNERFVILCVAAWNTYHKRIDYLLDEVAKLDRKNILLLLCGQPEANSEMLMRKAYEMDINTRWETLSQKDLSYAYSAADIFVLPSLSEGLPAVLIEASVYKLPVICHSHSAGKYIFGENYKGLTDLSIDGNLAQKIEDYKNSDEVQRQRFNIAEVELFKFNHEKLTRTFVNFLMHILKPGRTS